MTITSQIRQTGLYVPQLAFGTAPLATAPAWGSGEPIPQDQATEALQFAYNHGITFFDTAPNYGRGLAETRTGDVVSQLPREKIVIASKIGFVVQAGQVIQDYSRDAILRSLENTLKRLRVDYVDILHVHDADHHYQDVLNHAFPALAELRAQGVIKAIGAGMNQWQMLVDFANNADFDCFMSAGRYTLLEQGALPLLDLCVDKGIAIFVASIYNSGILATGTNHPNTRYNHASAPQDILQRVHAIENVCQQYNVPLHTVATQFPLGHPAVKSLVVGFQDKSEVTACLNALPQTIPPALWAHLKAENLLNYDVPTNHRNLS